MPWISPTVHVYVERGQPLTDYWDRVTEREMHFTTPPYKLFYCHACRRLRAAKDLNIHVYYDHSLIVCREKEWGRSSEFPFARQHVCIGTTFRAKTSEPT